MECKKNRAINKAKREYLLSGMIECMYCGGSYTAFASKNKSSGEETIYYMCGTKNRLHTCKAKNIRADEIEPAVYYIVRDELLNKDLIERTADAIIAIHGESKSSDNNIKQEISEKQTAIKNLLNAVEKGLNNEVALSRIDELQLEIKTLQARLALCNDASTTIDRNELIKKLREDAKKIDGDFEMRRAVIKEYVNKIIISDDGIEIQCIGDYDTTGGATQI